MTIVAEKQSNKIMFIGDEIGDLPNGYPLFEGNMAFVTDQVNLFPADSSLNIPDEVFENPDLYGYTEQDGFYLLPKKPYPDYGVDPAVVEQIQADYREKLMEEVATSGYNA